MTARENALRIIRIEQPKRVVSGLPTHGLAYRGAAVAGGNQR